MRKHLFTLICITSFVLTACSSSSKNEVIPTPKPTPEPTEFNELHSLKLIIESDSEVVTLEGELNTLKNKMEFNYRGWIDNIEEVKLSYNGTGKFYLNDKEVLSDETGVNMSSRTLNLILKSDTLLNQEYEVSLIAPQTTGLPVIKIDVTDNIDIGKLPKTKEYHPSTIHISDYKDNKYSLVANGGVRGRGNSTWGYPKKPMRIKFDDKTSLFGLAAEKSWVLLANYLDPTFLMNSVAFEIAHRLDLEFTNTDFHVELFYNGEYKGNYQLTEQVQVKDKRIQVDKKTGFLVELDTYFDDESKFRTNHLNLPVMVKYPTIKSDSEMDFIKEAFEELEQVLLDKEKRKTADLSKYIDIESFVKYMFVYEVTANYEVQHPKSVKMYKKNADEPLKLGPVWDFDWAYGKNPSMGNFDYFNYQEDLAFRPNLAGKAHTFFQLFLFNDEFCRKYIDLWNECNRNNMFDLDTFLDNKSKKLTNSQALNYELWNNGLLFQEQVNRMKIWLNDRVKYANREINNFR